MAVAAFAVALWAWGRAPSSPMTAARQRGAAAVRAPVPIDADRRDAMAEAVARAAVPPRPAPQPPGSLRDTEVDGAFALDANGRLLVTPAVRRFFEYFFVASGEEDNDVIQARIEAAIRTRLSGAARGAALDSRPPTYRARGRTLADGELGVTTRPSASRRSGAAPRQLRRGGCRRAVRRRGRSRAVVVARRIAADPALSADERAALAALVAWPEVRESRAAVTAPLRLARDEAALRAAGGAPEEIQALREHAVGSEAADRLAALDQRRTEWQGRVDAYRDERAAIDRDASLSDEQRETALEALRVRHFSGAELLRIRALDRMQAAAPP
jgi:lipase chaperone LimK